MGKASKLKAMRRIAKKMPVIQTRGIEVEYVDGSDLYKQGVTEVKGKPVDESKVYHKLKQVPKPLNHYKQMKEEYKKHGRAGVAGYIGAVDHFSKKQLSK